VNSFRRVYSTVIGNTLLRVQLVRSRAYTWENIALFVLFLGVFVGSVVRLAAYVENRLAIAELPAGAMIPDLADQFAAIGYWETVSQFLQIACIILLVLGLVFKAALLPWFTRYNFRGVLNENYRMIPVSESQLIFALMDWKVAKVFAVVLASLGLYYLTPKVEGDILQLSLLRTALLFVIAGSAWVYRLGQSRLFLRDFIRTRLFWAGLLWMLILIIPLFAMDRMHLLAFNAFESFRIMRPLYTFSTLYVFLSAVPVPQRVAERMIESARAPDPALAVQALAASITLNTADNPESDIRF